MSMTPRVVAGFCEGDTVAPVDCSDQMTEKHTVTEGMRGEAWSRPPSPRPVFGHAGELCVT